MRRLLTGVALIAGAWWITSAAVGSRVLPAPWEVVLRFGALVPTVLWRHILASTARVLAALVSAAIVAVPLAIADGRSEKLNAILSPVAYLLYPVPKIALLPLLLLTMGTGELTRVGIVFLVLFFQMFVSVRDGVRSVDTHYLESLDSLGANRWDRLRYVIWPLVVPHLLTALRIGSATALAVLFFAETFFTRVGLGFFIVDGWMKLAYVDMFTGILAMSLLGLVLFVGIDRLERSATRWRAGGSRYGGTEP